MEVYLVDLKKYPKFQDDEQLRGLFDSAVSIVSLARRLYKSGKSYRKSTSLIRRSHHAEAMRRLHRDGMKFDDTVKTFVDAGEGLPEEKRNDYFYLTRQIMDANPIASYNLLLKMREKYPETYLTFVPRGS